MYSYLKIGDNYYAKINDVGKIDVRWYVDTINGLEPTKRGISITRRQANVLIQVFSDLLDYEESYDEESD